MLKFLTLSLLLGIPSLYAQAPFHRAFYQEQLTKVKQMPVKPLILMGDSLTHRHHFSEFNATNMGIDGDTTDGILARLDDTKDAQCIILMIGVNDLLMGVKLSRIQRNYTDIFSSLHADQKLIILSILPVIDDVQTKQINLNIRTLNTWLKEEAAKHSYQFIDLYPHFSDGKGLKEEYSLDGIHLSLEAYKKWEELLRPYLPEGRSL